MNRQRVVILLALAVAVLLPGLALVASEPRPANAALPDAASADLAAFDFPVRCDGKVPGGLAQCGSQASSCKNCHEVKGEDPVNAEGDWHISHAFGDFCEFCHGGNVQATDKDAAHQGLIAPLGDVKTNCSTCHDDYEAQAEVYASALGVTVGAGSTGAKPPPATGSDTGSGPAQPTAEAAPAQAAPAAAETAPLPSGTQIVDYTRPAGQTEITPVSAGNIVVGLLFTLTVASGGAFIYWNEKRLRMADSRWRMAERVAPNSEIETPLRDISQLSPELQKLLPALQALDPRTLRALKIILADRRRGEEMLQSLSVINFSVLEEMKRLDKRELSLLLALAAET